MDYLNRWVFPIVPESSTCKYRRHNVYCDNKVILARTCNLIENVYIGEGSTVGNGTTISNSVIGKNCTIGENVQIENSFIWDGVTIADDCCVHSSIICSSCQILRESTISKCTISFNVDLGPKISLGPGAQALATEPCVRVSSLPSPALEDNFEEMSVTDECVGSQPLGSKIRGHIWPLDEDEEEEEVPHLNGPLKLDDDDSDYDSDESLDGSLPASPPPEQSSLQQFHTEVMENLRYGMTDSIATDNIALEINASKYKFNIDLPELCSTLMKACLSISITDDQAQTKQEIVQAFDKVLACHQNLLTKYFNSAEYQMHAILGIEDYFCQRSDDQVSVLANILQKLYDKDVLDERIIISWHSKPPMLSNTLRDNPILQKFMVWLQEADEESDEDDSEEESD